MYSKLFVGLFSLGLAWSNASEICFTPLGAQGKCVSTWMCDSLKDVFHQNPILSNVADFLEQSICGVDASGLKICCGPPPNMLAGILGPKKTPPRHGYGNIEIPSDPVEESDAYPEPRGSCGEDSSGNRIIGGEATSLDEFPWLALLMYRLPLGRMMHACGGSLLNRRYVMTAAHCLAIPKYVMTLAAVRLGEYDTGSTLDCIDGECADPVQEIPVQGYYYHSEYSSSDINSHNDIGLVRLSRRAQYTDFIKPICLVNHESPKYISGSKVVAAGWGRTAEHGSGSRYKLKVDLPIYESRKCYNKFLDWFQIYLSERQLCAGGENNKDTCHGDSGGPLMRILEDGIWEVVGIVSFGIGCGADGLPGVYTSVVDYLDWIETTMIETNDLFQ